MWGKNRCVHAVFAAVVASSGAVGCGGRSARHVAGETGDTGGTGGASAVAGAGGTLGVRGGAGGASGGSGGNGGNGGNGAVLRPCSGADVPRELYSSSPDGCAFSLDALPSERTLDPDHVTFMIYWNGLGALLERVELGEACSLGWQFSEEARRVILCPDVCESLRNDAGTTLEINVACDGPPPRN